MKKSILNELRAKGYTHLAIAKADYGDYKRGDIIRKIKTEKGIGQVKNNRYAEIKKIDDLLKVAK